MASEFSDRLDFLMNVTNTSNSALARELSFDASYISRIRNGKRGMPLHQPFIQPTAAYLARRVREPYQARMVEEVLELREGWPLEEGEGARLIARWLADDGITLGDRFDRLFVSLSTPPGPPAPLPDAPVSPDALSGASREFFIGNRGKRDATTRFLSELVATGEPHDLLVYSDENMEWLTEDPAFARRWLALLVQLASNGSSVLVVHTITRDIGEMLDAVQHWLPLYLTGKITSYYCPRLRDGISRRTLFVASGRLAVTSNSVGERTEGVVNLLVSEADAVDAYEREFRDLLALCRPLVEAVPVPRDLSALAEGAAYAAASPQGGVVAEDVGVPVRMTARLPHDVVAIVGEDVGFTLVHLAEPRIALRVTERLLTAAFVEYLR